MKKFRPVKRPGALTRKAQRAKMSVKAFARKNRHAPGLLGKQARFALIARTWHHKGAKRKAKRRAKRTTMRR